MARGRMLSKSLSTSQRFARLNAVAGRLAEFCQALYPLINAHADDFGRLQGDPFTIKHVCHPTSPRRVQEFGLALQHLDDVGLIRWYEIDGSAYVQIVKFDQHQTGLGKRTKSRFPDPPENSRDIPGVSAKLPANSTEPNSTELNSTELKEQSKSAEPSTGSTPPEPLTRAILEFPTVGPVPLWTLTDAQVGEWIALFPNLDIEAECRKALAWVLAKPNRAKTARGMPAFLVAWFGRAVDSRARAPNWMDGPGPGREGRIMGAAQRTVAAIRRGEL